MYTAWLQNKERCESRNRADPDHPELSGGTYTPLPSAAVHGPRRCGGLARPRLRSGASDFAVSIFRIGERPTEKAAAKAAVSGCIPGPCPRGSRYNLPSAASTGLRRGGFANCAPARAGAVLVRRPPEPGFRAAEHNRAPTACGAQATSLTGPPEALPARRADETRLSLHTDLLHTHRPKALAAAC